MTEENDIPQESAWFNWEDLTPELKHQAREVAVEESARRPLFDYQWQVRGGVVVGLQLPGRQESDPDSPPVPIVDEWLNWDELTEAAQHRLLNQVEAQGGAELMSREGQAERFAENYLFGVDGGGRLVAIASGENYREVRVMSPTQSPVVTESRWSAHWAQIEREKRRCLFHLAGVPVPFLDHDWRDLPDPERDKLLALMRGMAKMVCRIEGPPEGRARQ